MDTIKVFDNVALSTSGVSRSQIIDLAVYMDRPEYYLSVAKYEGAGIVDFTYEVGDDGHNFFVPYAETLVLEPFRDAHSRAVGSHGVIAGDTISLASIAGMTEMNAETGTVASTTATTITTDIDSSLFTPYVSGGVLTPEGESVRSCVITGVTVANPAVITVYRGRDMYKGTVTAGRFIKIVATENGTGTVTNLTAYLTLK